MFTTGVLLDGLTAALGVLGEEGCRLCESMNSYCDDVAAGGKTDSDIILDG